MEKNISAETLNGNFEVSLGVVYEKNHRQIFG